MRTSKKSRRTYAVALFSLVVLPLVTTGYGDRPCLFAYEPMMRQESEEEEAAKKIVQETTNLIVASRESDWAAFENRADARMTLGEFDNAVGDYSKAIILKSNEGLSSIIIIRKRMLAAIENDDYRQALSDAQTLAETNPPYALYYADLATILAKSRDVKVMNAARALEAAEYAESIRKMPSEIIPVELALAAAHSVNGNFDKAALHQERAIEAMTARGFDVPEEAKRELQAYKEGKTFPFPTKRMK